MGLGSKLGIISLAGASSFVNTYSFDFDGTDDYIDVPDADNLSFGNSVTDSPFSISAWIKMTDATLFRIVSKFQGSNGEYLLNTSGTDILYFRLLDSNTSNRLDKSFGTALTSYEGQWIHICATYDGSASTTGMKIYLNGNRVDNSSAVVGSYTAMHNTNAPFDIGRYQGVASYANGLIDEVAVFNSELSASNVTSIYNGGIPNDLSSLSPVSWWRMGDAATFAGGNWTLTDQGSGGNNGRSINMIDGSRSTDVPS